MVHAKPAKRRRRCSTCMVTDMCSLHWSGDLISLTVLDSGCLRWLEEKGKCTSCVQRDTSAQTGTRGIQEGTSATSGGDISQAVFYQRRPHRVCEPSPSPNLCNSPLIIRGIMSLGKALRAWGLCTKTKTSEPCCHCQILNLCKCASVQK